MSVFKIRRALAVAGPIYLGSAADAGLERSAAGVIRPLGSNDLAGGTIDASAGELRTGTIAAALANANVGTTKAGKLVIGHSGATIQFGFVHNGSVFIWSALAGTGAVTSAVGA